jgi:hypothetical protein
LRITERPEPVKGRWQPENALIYSPLGRCRTGKKKVKAIGQDRNDFSPGGFA